MRKGLVAIIAFCLVVAGWGCSAILSFWLSHELSVRPAEFDVRIERGVPMMTSDGIALVSDIYHPKDVARTPTILVRIPYSKTWLNTSFATVVGRMWAERGCVPSGGMVLRLFTGLENNTGSMAVLACGEAPISAIPSGCSRIKFKLGCLHWSSSSPARAGTGCSIRVGPSRLRVPLTGL